MNETSLPPRDEMLEAFRRRDPSYEGIFVTAVETTGIFCRPTCPARKPRPENTTFFPSAREALAAGFRPCRRCQPMEPVGTPPPWLRDLLETVDAEPTRRLTDRDLAELGVDPERVRRWFRRHHGMTFHAYARARRLGLAFERIRRGERVLDAALDHGYDSLSGFNEAFRNLLGAAPTEAGAGPLIHLRFLPTPLGRMLAGATEEALCLLEFVDRRGLEGQLRAMIRRLDGHLVPGTNEVLTATARQLDEYFAGQRRELSVPLAAPGTAHQEAVWTRLAAIPYGETTSYGALAAALGRKGGARAVGRAVGENRIAIAIPCHRVVGKDGRLTGYGGGLWRKRRLLELEGVHLDERPAAGPHGGVDALRATRAETSVSG